MEEFYSLQGEGANTGKASYFLRIGGCDVGCRWCDVKESWNALLHPLIKTDEVIERIITSPSKAVVVTGGEPLMYNLDYLCSRIKVFGIKTYLETSGAYPFSGNWDWVCLSPKKQNHPIDNAYTLASELKVVIQNKEDFFWAEQNAELCNVDCRLFLQPEWSNRYEIIPLIVDYILMNPKWNISVQTHKYIRIP